MSQAERCPVKCLVRLSPAPDSDKSKLALSGTYNVFSNFFKGMILLILFIYYFFVVIFEFIFFFILP